MSQSKIQVYIAQSLDGYIARKDGALDWLPMEMDEKIGTAYQEFYEGVDTIVMGRKTYEDITTVLSPNQWPYPNKKTYVCTTTPEKFTETDEVSFVKFDKETLLEIQSKAQKNIWILGGTSVVHDCIRWDLVDELLLCTISVILGDGISLFPQEEMPQQNFVVAETIVSALGVQINYKKEL